MQKGRADGELRQAVGVFATETVLQQAIDELLSSGFSQADLSLLAGEQAIEREMGHRYRKISELEDDINVPRVAYVSPETRGDAQGGLIGGLMYVGATAAAGAVVASGGTLAIAIAAAALVGGAGGLIGTALAKRVGDRHGRYLQEQLDHGGLLLWVRTADAEHEVRAVDVLKRHSGQDVHVVALVDTD